MVHRLAARLSGADEDTEILARRLLPNEIVERLGAQRGVDIFGLALGGEEAIGFVHGRSVP